MADDQYRCDSHIGSDTAIYSAGEGFQFRAPADDIPVGTGGLYRSVSDISRINEDLVLSA